MDIVVIIWLYAISNRMKRSNSRNVSSDVDIFLNNGMDCIDDIDENYVIDSDTFNEEDIEDLFEGRDEPCEEESESDTILSYKDYAMKKSNTKKVTSQNYDSADLHNNKQDISVPYIQDCAIDEEYFNEDLELCACEIIKGTSLDKYDDGRHIPIKDVVTCFVKLADKWPDDLAYCFTLMATYGKVLRYKSLLDAIPTSYRNRMISQLSSNGAELIRSLYKGEATVVDIFC